MDKKIDKKTWTPLRIGIIAAVVLGLGFVGRSFYKNAGVSKLNVTSDRLTVATVEKNKFQEFIPVTGVVLPLRTVRMDAIEGGKVERGIIDRQRHGHRHHAPARREGQERQRPDHVPRELRRGGQH